MNPKLIHMDALTLAGFDFYGNPFEVKDPWSEENEIGKLWQRFMGFLQQNGPVLDRIAVRKDAMYEVHLSHSDTSTTGEFEVFIGMAISQLTDLPVELVVKVLPPTQYAVFTISGEAISSDWHHEIYRQWMPQSGYSAAYPFSFQYYDHRFKGMDKLADSSIDIYVPIQINAEK